MALGQLFVAPFWAHRNSVIFSMHPLAVTCGTGKIRINVFFFVFFRCSLWLPVTGSYYSLRVWQYWSMPRPTTSRIWRERLCKNPVMVQKMGKSQRTTNISATKTVQNRFMPPSWWKTFAAWGWNWSGWEAQVQLSANIQQQSVHRKWTIYL